VRANVHMINDPWPRDVKFSRFGAVNGSYSSSSSAGDTWVSTVVLPVAMYLLRSYGFQFVLTGIVYGLRRPLEL
jgi:hypothetical protein